MKQNNKDEVEDTREKGRQLRKKKQYLKQIVEKKVAKKTIYYLVV